MLFSSLTGVGWGGNADLLLGWCVLGSNHHNGFFQSIQQQLLQVLQTSTQSSYTMRWVCAVTTTSFWQGRTHRSHPQLWNEHLCRIRHLLHHRLHGTRDRLLHWECHSRRWCPCYYLPTHEYSHVTCIYLCIRLTYFVFVCFQVRVWCLLCTRKQCRAFRSVRSGQSSSSSCSSALASAAR